MNDDLMELSERMDRMESLLKTIQKTMLGKTSNDDSSKRKDVTKSIVFKEETLSDLERSKIASVMENFDFYKVHKVMELLQWVWISCGEDGNAAVPTVGQMKAEAKRLLIEAAYEKTNISCGGFNAVYETTGPDDKDPYIVLEFIVEDCEGFEED